MTKKFVVIGTGYVGLPAALMWAKAGQQVVGVDINENVVRAINDRTMLLNETELQALLVDEDVRQNLVARQLPVAGDVFVIAVPTPVDPFKKVADLSHVEAAIKSICPVLRPGNLIIIESTVPPMTCRKLLKPLIEDNTGYKVPSEILVAHCPERILPGDIFREIVFNDRLLGGMDEASTQAARDAYASFVKGELLETNDVVAELSKLMENTYRDINIALANEFSRICERLEVDPYETIRLANRHPRVNILSPGIGVGGHCIPVDPWFLKEVAPYDSRLISMARMLNDEMPAHVAAKIRRGVRGVVAPRIIAIGASYKRNCEDTRESPAREVVHLLQDEGLDVGHFDPLVPGMTYQSIASICEGADYLAVLVNHDVVAEELADRAEIILSAMRTRNIKVFDVQI